MEAVKSKEWRRNNFPGGTWWQASILSNSPIFRNTLLANSRLELAEVNGQPALITRSGERALAVLTIDVEAEQIKAIRFVANPDKLAHI